jgi:hypothetical protein
MKIEQAIRACLHSTKRFKTVRETREACQSIASLPVAEWANVCKQHRIADQVLAGLVTQCGFAVRAMEWVETSGQKPKLDAIQDVLRTLEEAGKDPNASGTDPWRVYWGAWFLETKLPS